MFRAKLLQLSPTGGVLKGAPGPKLRTYMDPLVSVQIMEEMESMHSRLSALEIGFPSALFGKSDVPLAILTFIRTKKIDPGALLTEPGTITFSRQAIHYTLNIKSDSDLLLVDSNNISTQFKKVADLENFLSLMNKTETSHSAATATPARIEDIKSYSAAITQSKMTMMKSRF